MDMNVDEPRQQSAVAQIEDVGAGRAGDLRSHRHNALALCQHLAGSKHFAGLHVKQARRVDDDRPVLAVPQRTAKECRERGESTMAYHFFFAVFFNSASITDFIGSSSSEPLYRWPSMKMVGVPSTPA